MPLKAETVCVGPRGNMRKMLVLSDERGVTLPSYEWIRFGSLALALKWRRRNHRLKTAYDFDQPNKELLCR